MDVSGRVWCFGDDINTDLIQPMHTVFKPLTEQHRYVFEANRPGWVDLVEPGDVIVAGRNFGTGSSRPAAKLLVDLGIGALVADSINWLFFRNCVNFALPALGCPGVRAMFAEGQHARLDLAAGLVENTDTGQTRHGTPWTPELLDIVAAGGLLKQLERDGLLVAGSSDG
ncbi:3-isopropylmalate dehydratase [Pseudonocardia kunmingensis]|uniref:3-isopropylmalate dehydratase small subunit n=1 Tax=Pseudonocardia kunmingensis TaxID=630975 RepID=A0A543CXF6_9PSEU|nr:3-isopropylmalate dehydratase [Pseudonocardia kunmingensis]TQM01782.1 3-isopropylmalate/(R)-2-methylmalate dehydratase small subunit [Pseudonocardia kunmingensis]